MASAADAGPVAPQTGPGPAAPAHVQCWACGVLVQIPIINNQLSPVFRCGWCGAISEAAPPWLTESAATGGGGGGARRGGGGFTRLFRGGAWRMCMRLLSRLSYLVVLVVLALIGSIVLPGIGFVIPVVAGGSGLAWAAHTSLAYLLSAAVLFNLFAAMATSPGKPHECCRGLPPHTITTTTTSSSLSASSSTRGGRGGSGSGSTSTSTSCKGSTSSSSTGAGRGWWLFRRRRGAAATSANGAAADAAATATGAGTDAATAAAAAALVVPQYAYSHLRYCWSCRGPQPAEAQHCYVCGCCVVDLDHHCPFIANCVGRANLRNFVSFLGATVAAVVYCAAMAAAALWLERRAAGEVMREAFVAASRASRSGGGDGDGKAAGGWVARLAAAAEGLVWFLGSVVPRLPLRITVAAYIAMLSVGVLLSVGILLMQTVRHVVRHGSKGNGGGGGVREQHHLHPASDAAVEAAAAAREAAAARSAAGLAAEVVGGCGAAPARRSTFASVRRVMMGTGPEARDSVWMWVWPTWGPPPGVLVQEEGAAGGETSRGGEQGGGGAAGAAGRLSGAAVGARGLGEGEGLDPELVGGGLGGGSADACGGMAAAAAAAAAAAGVAAVAAAAATGVGAAARPKPKTQ